VVVAVFLINARYVFDFEGPRSAHDGHITHWNYGGRGLAGGGSSRGNGPAGPSPRAKVKLPSQNRTYINFIRL